MTKQTILITGATGFLGSNILKAFTEADDVHIIAACRDHTQLADDFTGEIREGNLTNPEYCRSVVEDVDVVCHAGTWAAMWNHQQEEHDNFYKPTINLLNNAMQAGVQRFIMTSTVAMPQPAHSDNTILDDFSTPQYTHFWPHLDRLVDIDQYMQAHADQGMTMISLRLGHFIGKGNTLGLVPALVPRLKTRLVPWINAGKSHLPLVSDADAANSFVLAAVARTLAPYESFNIVGTELPSTREVIEYIAKKTNSPLPAFNVSYSMAYTFAWLMEKLLPVLPGKAPFLTRSIVHLSENWVCTNQYAHAKLGYTPRKDWRLALDEALNELKINNYPWPRFSQKI